MEIIFSVCFNFIIRKILLRSSAKQSEKTISYGKLLLKTPGLSYDFKVRMEEV